MRMAATATVSLPYSEDVSVVPRTDTRLRFWQEFRRRIPEHRVKDTRRDEDFIHEKENVLRRQFPISLEDDLRRHWAVKIESAPLRIGGADLTVILKSISYGSLLLNFDVITGPLAAIGLTGDDFLNLLERYTPMALQSSLDQEINLDVKVTGSIVQPDDPQPVSTSPTPSQAATSPTSSQAGTPKSENSRLDRILNLANTSLVVVSAVLLVAAFLLFQNSSSERDRLTTALTQERSEIAAQREKLLDRYGDQLKGFREYLSDQAKRYQELEDTEAGFLKERLKHLKTQEARSGE